MIKQWGALFLCATSISTAYAETFVIQGERPGREATVKIPIGAVMKLSADFAEPLVDDADPQCEAMRLSGDVWISIAGSAQPIQIRADDVLLELTPDSAGSPPTRSRSEAAPDQSPRPTLPGNGDAQIFVGDVVFVVQTSAGPMEIKADRVEHRLQANEPGQAQSNRSEPGRDAGA